MLVVICGLPRSGTSYVYKLFANHSEKYFAVKTDIEEKKKYGVWCTDEPPVLGSFNGNYELLIKPLVRHYNNIGYRNVVYKHPQAILFAPFNVDIEIKYIVCHRGRDNWLVGAQNYEPTLNSVKVESEIYWVRKFWEGDWALPENDNDRLLKMYDIFKRQIDKFLENKNDTIYEFNYHEPQNSIGKIIEDFELNVSIDEALGRK